MTPTAAPLLARRTPFYKSLFVQVVAGWTLGILLGVAASQFAEGLKFFSDAFLKLISMIVAPIVFCMVAHGIAGAEDLQKVGRVGGKALLYFEVMITVALAVVVGPGRGMAIDTASLDALAVAHARTAPSHSWHWAGALTCSSQHGPQSVCSSEL